MNDPFGSDSPNVDADELSKFAALAPIWWDRRGALKALHDINGLRVAYVNGRAPLAGRRVIDLGCGGGILSDGRVTVARSIFSGNSTLYMGGGAAVFDDAAFEDSLFCGNTARDGAYTFRPHSFAVLTLR